MLIYFIFFFFRNVLLRFLSHPFHLNDFFSFFFYFSFIFTTVLLRSGLCFSFIPFNMFIIWCMGIMHVVLYVFGGKGLITESMNFLLKHLQAFVVEILLNLHPVHHIPYMWIVFSNDLPLGHYICSVGYIFNKASIYEDLLSPS